MNGWYVRLRILAAILLALSGGSMAVAEESDERGEHAKTLNVDCSRGESIARALARVEERKSTLIVIRGVCNESVRIERSDVKLRGDGGTINGGTPDANGVDTVTVIAERVAIEDLSITGGRNGITGFGAAGLTVRNTTIQSTGRNGISYADGSSVTVDGCTIQSNARDGVSVERASAAIINSDISHNARNGVLIGTGGSARIRVVDRHPGLPRRATGPTRTLL